MRTLNSSTTTRDVIIAFKLATAEMKLQALIRALQHYRLALRYRPDQPRAPRGTPIGGQWIDDGGPDGRLRKLTAELGVRILAWKDPGMVGRAIYKFEFFSVVVSVGQRIPPLVLDHTSPVIESGRLLNDNTKKPR